MEDKKIQEHIFVLLFTKKNFQATKYLGDDKISHCKQLVNLVALGEFSFVIIKCCNYW